MRARALVRRGCGIKVERADALRGRWRDRFVLCGRLYALLFRRRGVSSRGMRAHSSFRF